MNITLEIILNAVQGDLDISVKNREFHNIQLRRVYYKIAKDLTRHTLKDIGKLVNRDRTTVLYHSERFYLVEKSVYIKVYYRCLDELTGSKKLEEYFETKGRDNVNSVILPKSLLNKLRMLNQEQLNDFEKLRLDPYLKMNVK